MKNEPLEPVATAAEAAARNDPKDAANNAAEMLVHDAAHAAATVEADAAIAAAKAQEDAAKIEKDAGARAAEKWLEARLVEIEDAGNKRMEGLKQWLDERLKQLEGKKPAEEKPPAEAEPPAAPPAAPPASEPPAAPAKKRYRMI